MRLFVLTLLFCNSSWGYGCPSYLDTVASTQSMHNWLERFKHITEIGDCTLEIVSCDKEADKLDSAPIGEVLITDKNGRTGYIRIEWSDINPNLLRTRIRNTKHKIKYKKTDRFYEEEFGRTEYWRLEMKTSLFDENQLRRLELFTYTTHKTLDDGGNPKPRRTRRYICRPSN